MRAVVLDESDPAVGVAEGDQVFAEEPNTHRRAVRLGEFLGYNRRQPVLPQQVTHDCTGPDTSEEFVFFFTQHERSPRLTSVVAAEPRPYLKMYDLETTARPR